MVLGGRGGAGRCARSGARVPGGRTEGVSYINAWGGAGRRALCLEGVRRRYLGVGRGPGGGPSACRGRFLRADCGKPGFLPESCAVLRSLVGVTFQLPQLAPALAAALLPGGLEVPHLEVPRHTQVKRASVSGLAYLRRSFRVTDRKVGFKKGGAHGTRLTLSFPSGPHLKPGGEGGPPPRRLGDSG